MEQGGRVEEEVGKRELGKQVRSAVRINDSFSRVKPNSLLVSRTMSLELLGAASQHFCDLKNVA